MNNTTKLIGWIIAVALIGIVAAGIYKFTITNDDIYVEHSGMMVKYNDTKTEKNQDDAMREHCKMMPDMPGCEKYLEDKSSTLSGEKHGTWKHTMNHADMIQSEFDFITLMIPHHQEAVDTTTALLTTTSNPNLITLGKAIVTNQTKEIEMMKWWLTTWYSGIEYHWMPYMPMMQQTQWLSTWDIDIQWTKDMIIHHQWAVDMAQKLIKIMDIKDKLINSTWDQLQFRKNLRTFAQNIITTQTQEIKTMQQILAN